MLDFMGPDGRESPAELSQASFAPASPVWPVISAPLDSTSTSVRTIAICLLTCKEVRQFGEAELSSTDGRVGPRADRVFGLPGPCSDRTGCTVINGVIGRINGAIRRGGRDQSGWSSDNPTARDTTCRQRNGSHEMTGCGRDRPTGRWGSMIAALPARTNGETCVTKRVVPPGGMGSHRPLTWVAFHPWPLLHRSR